MVIETCFLEIQQPDNEFYQANLTSTNINPDTPLSEINPVDLEAAAVESEKSGSSESNSSSKGQLMSGYMGSLGIGISEAGQRAADAAGDSGSSSTGAASGSTGGDAGTGGDSAGGNDGGGMGGSP